MENHPIPQDVTGFKFKLIGSVTLKQFLYILAGGILAIVCFVLPVTAFIKYPLSLFFGGMGVALAFIPIEGRPMDIMIKNFLRALPAENQYIFHKKGAEALIYDFFTPIPVATSAIPPQKPAEHASPLDTKRDLLYKTLRQAHKPDAKEQDALTSINSILHETTGSAQTNMTPPSPAQSVAPPMPAEVQKSFATQAVKLPQYTAAPVVESQPQTIIRSQNSQASDAMPQAPSQETTPRPIDTLIAKPAPQVQNAEPAPIQSTPAQVVPPQPSAPQPIEPTPSLDAPELAQTQPAAPQPQTITVSSNPAAPGGMKAGFPQLPDVPNIVLGIIKDPRGRVLPNILVEILNGQGVPVRAFKTNALGQFAAATPLTNGEYIVVLEDSRKQNEFEQFKIILDGQIFQPLEIVSVDQREKLRRELFGTANSAQIASQ